MSELICKNYVFCEITKLFSGIQYVVEKSIPYYIVKELALIIEFSLKNYEQQINVWIIFF